MNILLKIPDSLEMDSNAPGRNSNSDNLVTYPFSILRLITPSRSKNRVQAGSRFQFFEFFLRSFIVLRNANVYKVKIRDKGPDLKRAILFLKNLLFKREGRERHRLYMVLIKPMTDQIRSTINESFVHILLFIETRYTPIVSQRK